MGIIDKILKISIGYERKDHKFDSSRLPVGHVKFFKEDEMIKNAEGKLIFCKKDQRGNWNCKSLKIKERKIINHL